MKHSNFEIFLESKFTQLLGALVALFALSPFIDKVVHGVPIVSVLFMFAIIMTLRALSLPKAAFSVYSVMAGVAILSNFIVKMGLLAGYQTILIVISATAYAGFLLMSSISLAKRVFTAGKITLDTIMGGICIYFLMGFLWSVFYAVIGYFDKGAFGVVPGGRFISYYFSFSTLTTLGYGDIWPVNTAAMVLSNLEAIFGQVYLAVFVGRLVGLHISHQARKE